MHSFNAGDHTALACLSSATYARPGVLRNHDAEDHGPDGYVHGWTYNFHMERPAFS